MLLSELNLKALNINASSILPVEKIVNVEGKELKIKIGNFQSNYGSGKKTVISGSILRVDNRTEKVLENADIEKVRRVCASLCELTTSGRTTDRKPRTQKEQSEVEKLRAALAVARRLPKDWISINAAGVWKAYQDAKKADKEREQKALKEKAVSPLLAKIEKLTPEERALLLASLQ